MNGALAATVAASIGGALAFAAARALAPMAARLRLIDRPGPRKPQTFPVPLVGGVALLLAGLSGFAARAATGVGDGRGDGALRWLPLATFAIGLADDAGGKKLAAGSKALLTVGALAVAIWAAGIGATEGAFALVALFALIHATNTVDHVDGLCAGACAVALFDAAGVAVLRGEDGFALPLAALAGGALGFLFLNFPRARVFLGDSGTLLLGGCLAGLWLHWRRPEVFVLATVPLADFISVAWLRLADGQRPWIGDRRHVTHRLIARGVAPARAVVALLVLQAACAAIGAWLLAGPQPLALPAASAVSVGLVGLVALAFLGVTAPKA